MRSRAFLIVFLLLPFWLLSAAMGADAFDAVARGRLQASLRKLKNVYQHASGEVYVSKILDCKRYSSLLNNRPIQRTDPTTKALITVDEPYFTTEEHVLTFAIDGPLKRYRSTKGLDLTIDEASNPDALVVVPRMRRDPIAELAACSGESYFFRLRWPELGSKPVMIEFEPATKPVGNVPKPGATDTRAEFDKTFRSVIENALFSPVRFGAFDLVELLDDPKFVVTSVEPVTHHGHACSRYNITHEMKAPDRVKKTSIDVRYSGWFIACPSEGYAVHESMINFGGKRKPLHVEVEFQGESDGIRLPRLVRDGTSAGPSTDVYEFKSLRVGPTPKSEFTLAAFGMPEVESPLAATTRAPARTSFVPMLAAASVISLALAFVLKRKARRPELRGA